MTHPDSHRIDQIEATLACLQISVCSLQAQVVEAADSKKEHACTPDKPAEIRTDRPLSEPVILTPEHEKLSDEVLRNEVEDTVEFLIWNSSESDMIAMLDNLPTHLRSEVRRRVALNILQRLVDHPLQRSARNLRQISKLIQEI